MFEHRAPRFRGRPSETAEPQQSKVTSGAGCRTPARGRRSTLLSTRLLSTGGNRSFAFGDLDLDFLEDLAGHRGVVTELHGELTPAGGR